MVGALLCHPDLDSLTPAQRAQLNEGLAVQIYSDATALDNAPGQYPPTDTGSDGLSAAKAAQRRGFLSGYKHAVTLTDALDALTLGPVIIGINWYSGFDSPAPSGEVHRSGYVRGGHEVCLDEIDRENSRVWFRNSWSESWGLDGRAWMSFATLAALLSERGDATILVPASQPAPQPEPAPVDMVFKAILRRLARLVKWLEAHEPF